MSFLHTAEAQEHRDIFEGKAHVGPLNPILRSVTIKDSSTKPRETSPYLLDFHFPHPTGNINDPLRQAQVQFEKLGEIIVTTKERPFIMRYALPSGLGFKEQETIDEATVILKSSSMPDGPQKRVIINQKDQMNTAFFWETHSAAFSYKTPDGLLIEQEPINDSYEQREGYVRVPLTVFANGQKQPLEPGKPLRFEHNGREYVGYALESSYLYADDDGGCASGGYIIRAIISASIQLN
jgi:hypothetical protein